MRGLPRARDRANVATALAAIHPAKGKPARGAFVQSGVVMGDKFVVAARRVGAIGLVIALGGVLAACSGSGGSSPSAASKVAAAGAAKPGVLKQASAQPANRLQAMTVDQLMSAAQKALKDNRLVAPAGDNAFEYYLAVLKKHPNNRAAQDALRETFPYGAQSVDQTINQKDFSEAQREIDLLAAADPTNYTLTILRSKLDAARKLAAQQQAAQAAQQQTARAASAAEKARLAAAANALKAQTQTNTAQQQASALQQQQAQAAALRQQQQEAAAALRQQQAAQAAQAARSLNRDAQIVRQVPPRYPLEAARDGEQGWVDVEFTVNADGTVSNAHVTNSDPPQVFDRAALEAVSRWRFKPALINGTATAVVLKRRVEFKLAGNG